MKDMPTEYREYLKSARWVEYSEQVKTETRACEGCGLRRLWARYLYGQDLNVHHLTYERVGCERREDVRVLCLRCHAVAEGLPLPVPLEHIEVWRRHDGFQSVGDSIKQVVLQATDFYFRRPMEGQCEERSGYGD